MYEYCDDLLDNLLTAHFAAAHVCGLWAVFLCFCCSQSITTCPVASNMVWGLKPASVPLRSMKRFTRFLNYLEFELETSSFNKWKCTLYSKKVKVCNGLPIRWLGILLKKEIHKIKMFWLIHWTAIIFNHQNFFFQNSLLGLNHNKEKPIRYIAL